MSAITNNKIDTANVDEAIDAVAFLIEQDNKTPEEAINIVITKFNITKEVLLTEFENAFLCKPDEYRVICDEEENWLPDCMDTEFDDLDKLDTNALSTLLD